MLLILIERKEILLTRVFLLILLNHWHWGRERFEAEEVVCRLGLLITDFRRLLLWHVTKAEHIVGFITFLCHNRVRSFSHIEATEGETLHWLAWRWGSFDFRLFFRYSNDFLSVKFAGELKPTFLLFRHRSGLYDLIVLSFFFFDRQ